MHINEFIFNLPEYLIATNPVIPRDSSRILIADNSKDYFSIKYFTEIIDYLNPDDLLIFNNSKVIPALITGFTKNNSQFNINLNKAIDDGLWTCFIKNSKRLKLGAELYFNDFLSAEIIDKDQDGLITLQFNCSNEKLLKILDEIGKMPIPPYILKNRQKNKQAVDQKQDNDNYQTIYAKHLGSVAAPTAGLHFTEDLVNEILAKKIDIGFLTLHIGAGTFLPVKTDNVEDHKMHSEYYEISQELSDKINHTIAKGGRIIAVGTTTLRALEATMCSKNKIEPFFGETDIFITPGYKFKIINAMITNFHLPKSTLFMLICAFSGVKKMHAAYQYAIEQQMRFYSYGDACFLTRHE
ncbi:MAG: tRNA preQ1(34) S-adenosylmethionine ribosyltransferase-isomerase QueA [Pseudomonadota bacterium]